MKKRLLSLAVACLGLAANSFGQTILTQNFATATPPAMPTGWVNTHTGAGGHGWETSSVDVSLYFSTATADAAHGTFAVVNDFASPNNDPAFMTSPTFSLAGATGAYLSFDYNFDEAYTTGTPAKYEHAWVDLSTDGGTTWTTIDTIHYITTDAWASAYISLAAYSGDANCQLRFGYTDNGGDLLGVAIDNISVFVPATNDIALTSLDQVAGTPSSWGIAGAAKTISGTVFNAGATTITSYTVYVSVNGGTPTSSTISASIPAFGTATFTDASAITALPAAGTYPVKVWVSLTGDVNPTNDSAATTVTVFDSLAPKTVLIEEFNQASCDPCAAATPNLDSVYDNNASRSIMVRYHVNFPGRDFMDSVTLDAFVQDQLTFYNVTGVPDAQVDGAYVYPGSAGPGSMSTAVLGAAASVGAPFKIAVTPTFNATTQTYSFSATVTSLASFPAGLKLRAALTVDKITYALNQSTESIPQYNFPEVAENMFPDAGGQSLAAFTAGSSQTLTGSWTKNHPWASHGDTWAYDSTLTGKIVAWVQDDATGYVYQAGYAAVSTVFTTGVATVSNNASMDVYPNPATKTATVALSLKANTNITMEVLNTLGQVVYTMPAQSRNAGVSMSTIDVSNFAAGQYFVKISAGTEVMTKQLTVIK